ncbi:MAG: hypothetical protein Q8R01_01840 [Ramlibacter sp.]|nr:hypothetical protein [Ramlibacter sp.]
MPSSNFLRSRWLLYLIMAITLGCASPAIGRLFDFAEPAARHGLLYWWFMGIPVEVDLLVWPAEEYQYLLLASVFSLQYLLVFAAGALLVLLMQRRAAKKRRQPFAQPPEQQRAFETAAAVYNTRDGW